MVNNTLKKNIIILLALGCGQAIHAAENGAPPPVVKWQPVPETPA